MPRAFSSSTARCEHGQRLQAEEVELHQAGLLDPFHVELGRRQVGARIAVERHQLVERPVADHDAGGVGRGVAVEAFELQRRSSSRPRDRLVGSRISCSRGSPSIACCRRDRIGRVVRDQLARGGRPGRSGICSTRPTSRSTARACSVPKVMICATRSWPYCCWT